MKRLLLLLAACSTPATSSTEQASTLVFPAAHDFGGVQVHTTSGASPFTVSPSLGENYDTITAITAPCSDFAVQADGLPFDVYRTCQIISCSQNCNQTLAPSLCPTDMEQDYSFTATFQPNVPGPTSCMVTIEFSTQPPRTINLTGTGIAPPIDIDVSPTSINFGDVRRNTTSTPVALAIRDLGGSALHVASLAIDPGFAITPTGAVDIPPGGSQPYAITCTPGNLGALTGSLVVTSNDPATPTVTIPLSCTGIDSNLDISPSPAVLAPTRVGEPVQMTIAVTNSGTAASMIETVAITGDLTMISPPGATLLAPGGSLPVTVAYAATTNASATGTLAVTYDGGQVRTTQLSARALATSMSLTPGDVELGPMCAGQTATQDFTILANDEGAFSLIDLAPPAAPFTLAAPTLPAHVDGAGAKPVTFSITAAPTDAGTFTSQIAISTDIPNGVTRAVSLTAISLGAGITATPAALDFGSQQIGEHQLGREIHVTNCASAGVQFTDARLIGDNASEFAIVSQPPADALAPAQTAAWLVVLTTRSVGLKHAQFAVDYAGGTATVDLDGEALGEPAAKLDLHSYYACNAATPSTAWPTLLAFALISRRRRARLGR